MSFTPLRLAVVCAALLGSTGAAAAKVIVFPPTANAALTKDEAVVIADAVAAATSRAGHDVITQQQIQAVLGLEGMRQLAGCDDSSCLSDLSDSLGAESILTVAVGTIGQSVIVTLKRTDTKGGNNRIGDRRFKKGKDAVDGILDALPTLVGEVLAGAPTSMPVTTSSSTTTTTTPPATTTPAATTTTTLPVLAADKLPKARVDEPIATPKGLTFVSDGKGRVIAFATKDPLESPLYAGTITATGTTLYVVHDGSGKSSDGEGGWDRSFWDPRIGGGGADRAFERRKGVYTLTCGKTSTTFTELKMAPTSLKVHKPAWRRQALLIARDDTLRYVVVDADREAEPIADRRVYLGKKGKLVPLDLEIEPDASWGRGGIIAVGDGVTLKLADGGGVLIEGSGTTQVQTPFTGLDLWDNAALLYTEVKPSGDVQLGTPCDGLVPAKR
ncbi:MAG TPA: hypothetical protein VGF99_09765 [Myxococcota bacterium]